MKLRDFELCVSNFDKDNTEFNIQVRCLLAHFFKFYKKQDTTDVKKIVIELEPHGADFYSNSKHPVPEFENTLGIVISRYEFDFPKYWGLPEIERGKYALSAFVSGIKDVCEKTGIETTHFDEIADQIASDDYLYQGYWKKKALANPSKDRKANIFFKYLTDKVEIFAEVHSETDEPKLTLIEEISPPYLYEFDNAFGKLYWESDTDLVFEHKTGNKKIKLDTNSI